MCHEVKAFYLDMIHWHPSTESNGAGTKNSSNLEARNVDNLSQRNPFKVFSGVIKEAGVKRHNVSVATTLC